MLIDATWMQAGEAPTEDIDRDWQRLERDRSQLWDMKRQVQHHAGHLSCYDAVDVQVAHYVGISTCTASITAY